MTTTPSTAPVRLTDDAPHPLRTLDPAAPDDDLAFLDRAIGDARVIAIGENAHYNRESFELRHRLLRYLVERHGFSAYAMESGSVEGVRVDDWVRGGPDDPDELGRVMAEGMTSLMGLWTQMRDQLAWMRRYNRGAVRPVAFAGIDLPGSLVSLLPGLDAVTAYLAHADPGLPVDPSPRATAEAFAAASAFSAPATVATYTGLAADRRDALTAGLVDLSARLAASRLEYVSRTGADAYERARQALSVTVALDAVARALARGDQHQVMQHRDAVIADTVRQVLRRHERIVLAAHNGHVQRCPGALPGMPAMATAGMHLADRLGSDYLVIVTTTGTGQTLNTAPDFYTGTLFTGLPPAPEPGSLDALMAASHGGPFAVDLRRLSPADTATLRAVTRQRYGTLSAEINPLEAADLIIHLPHVTPADPDPAALAHAPHEVQQAFGRWTRR